MKHTKSRDETSDTAKKMLDKFVVLPQAEDTEEDEIHSPSHYRLFPDVEVIQAIEKMLTPKEYRGYLKGSILKYRLRAGKKGMQYNTVKDIQKSMQYDKFLEEAEAKAQRSTKEEL